MLEYILRKQKENGTLPKNGAVVKTIVTTELVRKIADDFNVETLDVLTGFKFIGEKIKEFEKSKEYSYIFGLEESLYLLTYTGVSFSDEGALQTPGLLAVSKDLEKWEFLGEKFPARAVCIINEKIDGRYWGYYGNSNKYITWSEDLINWNCDGETIIKPRPGYFDSVLCEGACPPIVTDEGILFIYNGATSIEATKEYSRNTFGMESYTNWGMYTTGWVLIDRNDPRKIIARSEEPFLTPYTGFECYGFVNFTIFSGGHVEFKGKHYLYYGACDTRICVAVAD